MKQHYQLGSAYNQRFIASIAGITERDRDAVMDGIRQSYSRISHGVFSAGYEVAQRRFMDRFLINGVNNRTDADIRRELLMDWLSAYSTMARLRKDMVRDPDIAAIRLIATDYHPNVRQAAMRVLFAVSADIAGTIPAVSQPVWRRAAQRLPLMARIF